MPVFVKTATGWAKVPKGAIDVKATATGFADVNQVWIKYASADIATIVAKQTTGRTLITTSANKYTIPYEGSVGWIMGNSLRVASDKVSHNKWNVAGSNGSASYTNLVAPMTGVFCRYFNNPTSTGNISRVKVRFSYSLYDTSGKGKWLGKVAPRIAASGTRYVPGNWSANKDAKKTYTIQCKSDNGRTYDKVLDIFYNSAPVGHYSPSTVPTSMRVSVTSGGWNDRTTYIGAVNPRLFYNEYLNPGHWWKVPALATVEKALPALGTATGAIATAEVWLDLPAPVTDGERIYVYFYGATCSSVESITDLPQPLAFKINEVSLLEVEYSTPASPWGFVWDTVNLKGIYSGQWWQISGREGVDPNGKIITKETGKEAEIWGGTKICKDMITPRRRESIKRIRITVGIKSAMGSWHGNGGRYWVTTAEKNVSSRPSGTWTRQEGGGKQTSPWIDVDIAPDETIRVYCEGSGDSGDGKEIQSVSIFDVEFAQ